MTGCSREVSLRVRPNPSTSPPSALTIIGASQRNPSFLGFQSGFWTNKSIPLRLDVSGEAAATSDKTLMVLVQHLAKGAGKPQGTTMRAKGGPTTRLYVQKYGGGGGIRTHGPHRPTVFKTAPLNHSGTPPRFQSYHRNRAPSRTTSYHRLPQHQTRASINTPKPSIELSNPPAV